MKESIKTDKKIMQIYPHTATLFHQFMGILMAFLVPAGLVLFPVLVVVKLIIYSIFYVITSPLMNTKAFKKIWNLKNCLLLPLHYYIYKSSYIYITIWLNNSILSFDEYWFGLDMAQYKDYKDFRTTYRRKATRRKFRLKLEAYDEQGFVEEDVIGRLAFYKVLFSYGLFRLIKESNFRKNGDSSIFYAVMLIIRDYHLLLLLPMHLRIYKNRGKIVGLSSTLIRGNTFLACQCIIASGYTRYGIFYKMMKDLMEKAFHLENIRFISSGPTANQSKQTSGYYPINYLLTDEFKYLPFSLIE